MSSIVLKKDNEVWVRWKFVGACGTLEVVKESQVNSWMQAECREGPPEFLECGSFEIVDGMSCLTIDASEVPQ